MALTILIAILSLLLTSSSPTSSLNRAHESFMRCFHDRTSSTSSQLIYTPKTAGYNSILNSSIQNNRFLFSPTSKKPALIVTPTAESHVQAAVICSRKHGLHVRARSGGHDYEGMSYISEGRGDDQFIAVDLSNLRSIAVDAEQGTAWVQAGATLGELYYTIAAKNRTTAFSAGTCPTVGVGGHFSGGGIGVLSRKYGLAADSVVDAKVVDVNGRLLNRECMGEDYFWAVRGGGAASFGIVVSFKIKLVAVPPIVTAFNVIRTLKEGATELVGKWQRIGPNLDEDLYVRIDVQAINDSNAKGNRSIEAAFSSLYLGRCKELIAVMERSFPELGFEAKDCNEMSWLESVLYFSGYSGKPTEMLMNRTRQFDISFKAKSDFVEEAVSEEGLEEIWRFLMEARDQPVTLIMEPFGGIMSEISESAIPFPHRKGNLYMIQYIMPWLETDLKTTERHLSWMRKLYDFMTPYVSKNPRAAYVNYKDIDLGMNDEHASYSKGRVWGLKYFKNNFKRLSYVKNKVDPDNFFKNKQSIPPLRLL
ncbi:flavin-dependent oxidoreductase FOX2-like [Canna indica]|uniref:Flavin-dependent oxidoreductase FOX2-like n=1 Tax=Canna indica TaxID=4628 RepID=A0AAQ3K766_9LILI|nr:flavin-dependent oxidoreductase FOX2-like [Canna indica]